jgi:hypothetical protein
MSIGRRRRGGLNPGGGFSPRAIPGLVFWVDASYITGLNDGDSVTTWSDLSGNGNDATQATAAAKPILKLNIINGRPVVRFDGTDDFLRATFTLNQPFTRISVFSKLLWVLTDSIFNAVTTSAGALYMQTATPRITMYSGGNGPSTTTFADNSFGIISEIFNDASSELHINGGSAFTGNPSTNNPTALTIGGNQIGAANSQIDVAMVVEYNSALSTANRQRLERYLSSRYGIAVA